MALGSRDLTYLHSCIDQASAGPGPECRCTRCVPGRRTADRRARARSATHLRTLTVMGFPSVTQPGILDELNRLAFPTAGQPRHRARQDGRHQALTRIRRQWFAKRKSIVAILKE